MSAHPSITAFVESREQAAKAIERGHAKTRGDYLLQNIASDPVVDCLREVNGRLSVAMNQAEISGDRALVELLRHFNTQGIPVDLWANLDDEDGYWIHAGNIQAARKAILEMLNSLERADVKMDRIGLDLEFPAPIMVPGFSIGEYIKIAPWRFSQDKAADQLHGFVEEVLGQSEYGVDTYEIPILGDNRLARRLLGIPRAPVVESPKYKRVGMVYTSVKPPLISAGSFIEKYSRGKGRIPALGIVSSSGQNPGRNMDFKGLLNDEELYRDVAAALKASPKEFYVFALNGLRMIERVRDAVRHALFA